MKKFYCNRDFFNTFLGCCIPLFDDVYLEIRSRLTKFQGHRSFLRFYGNFVVKSGSDFIPCFKVSFDVSNRKIQMYSVSYCLESDFRIAQVNTFPISPAWFLPSTNYLNWLNNCKLSLRVYRKEDFI